MRKTSIQWCDSTENPVAGCSGCELWTGTEKPCYAGFLHKRFGKTNLGYSRRFVSFESQWGPISVAGRLDTISWVTLAGLNPARANAPRNSKSIGAHTPP